MKVPPEIALYILNHKRAQLTAIEDRHGVYIYIEAKASLAASTYEIERGASVPFEPRKATATAVTVESELEANDDVFESSDEEPDNDVPESDERAAVEGGQPSAQGGEQDGHKRKRRRRRGGRDRERGPAQGQPPGMGPQPPVPYGGEAPEMVASSNDDDGDDDADDAPATDGGAYPAGPRSATAENGDGEPRRRRRGRRGRRGRRPGEGGGEPQPAQQQQMSPIGRLPTPANALDAPDWPATGGYDTQPGERPPVSRDVPQRNPRRPDQTQNNQASATTDEAKPETKSDRPSIASLFGFGPKADSGASVDGNEPKAERKGGWWQKKTGA